MTPGEAYETGKLVRVVVRGKYPFTAGLIIGRESRRVVYAAPILWHYLGQPEDKVRASFKRLGWQATIVRDFAPP